MKARTIALAGLAVVAVVVLAVLAPWRSTEAIGPDVNNDGQVALGDILEVLFAFGQVIPTPTLQPTVTPQPTATPQPTPTPEPPREQQLVFWAVYQGSVFSFGGCCSPGPYFRSSLLARPLRVDTLYYEGATFQFELLVKGDSPYFFCFQLADIDLGGDLGGVDGSEVCTDGAGPTEQLMRSSPFALPLGDNTYVMETRKNGAGGFLRDVLAVRLIARWPGG